MALARKKATTIALEPEMDRLLTLAAGSLAVASESAPRVNRAIAGPSPVMAHLGWPPEVASVSRPIFSGRPAASARVVAP